MQVVTTDMLENVLQTGWIICISSDFLSLFQIVYITGISSYQSKFIVNIKFPNLVETIITSVSMDYTYKS